MKIEFISIFLLLCPLTGFSQFSLEAQQLFRAKKEVANAAEKQALGNILDDYEVVALPAKELYRLASQSDGPVEFRLEIGAHNWKVRLRLHDIRAPGHRLVYMTENGPVTQPETRAATYVGYLDDNPENQVRISILENCVMGYFKSGETYYYIEPANFLLNKPAEPIRQHVFYEVSKLKESTALSCGAGHFIAGLEQKPEPVSSQPASYCLKIAVEADYEYWLRYNFLTGVRMLQIFSEVAGFYNSWLNIDFQITHSVIWIFNIDPYSGSSITQTWCQLQAWNSPVGSQYCSNQTPNNAGEGIDRDAWHLFSGRILNQHGTGGPSTMCVDLNNAYAVGVGVKGSGQGSQAGQPLSEHSEAKIHAHELGHIFSAGHVSSNSIMNGSQPYNSGSAFSQQSKNQINNHLNNHSYCLRCPSSSGGCCVMGPRDTPEERALKSNTAVFAAGNLRQWALQAQKTYIRHREEIDRMLQSGDPKYAALQHAFDELWEGVSPLVYSTFYFGSRDKVSAAQLDFADRFLMELGAVSGNSELEKEIALARQRLQLMQGKDLKSALIAFDRDQLPAGQTGGQGEPGFRLTNNPGGVSTLWLVMPAEGRAQIDLWNINGQRQRRLLDAPYGAGTHSFRIDTNDLPNGIYIVKTTLILPEGKVQNAQKLIVSR